MNTQIGVYILQVLLFASNACAQFQFATDLIYVDYEASQSSSVPRGNAIDVIYDVTTLASDISSDVVFGISSVAPKLKDNDSRDVHDKTTTKDDIEVASLPLTTVTDAPDFMGINDTALFSGDNETTQQPNGTDAPHRGVEVKNPIDEKFTNHLVLEGHVSGRENVLQNALHLSLLTDEYFRSQQWYLTVRAVSVSFIRTWDGRAITDVQYVVTYGNYVIETFHVQRILSKPEVHRHLHHNLETNSMKGHVWEPKYTVALGVGGVVIGIMILVFVAAIVTKRKPKLAGRKKSPAGKGPCVTPREVTDKRKLFEVDDGGFNNPAYNFNSSSVLDGEFCA